MALIDLKSNLSLYRKKSSKYTEDVQSNQSSRLLNEDRKSSLSVSRANLSRLEGNVVDPDINKRLSRTSGVVTNPKVDVQKSQTEDNIVDPKIKVKLSPLSEVVVDPEIPVENQQLDNIVVDPKISTKAQTLSGVVIDPKVETTNQQLDDIVVDPEIKTTQQQLDDIVVDPEIPVENQQLDNIVVDPEIKTTQQQLDNIVVIPGITTNLYDQLSDLVNKNLPEIPTLSGVELLSFFNEEKQREVYNNNGITLQKFLPSYTTARGLQRVNQIDIGDNSYFSSRGNSVDNQDFIRGGIAADRIAQEDARKFTNWLETQKGKQWLVLQQGLHLMNPNVETNDILGIPPTKIFNPSNLIQTIRGSYAGIRVPSIGTDSKDAFRNSYEEAIKGQSANQNRMIKLYKELIEPDRNRLILGINKQVGKKGEFFKRAGEVFSGVRDLIGIGQGILTGITTIFGGSEAINKINAIIAGIDTILEIAFPENQVISTLTGLGGPNSALGVGQTRIYRYTNTIKEIASLNIRKPNQGVVAGLKGLEAITRTSSNPYTDINGTPGKVTFDEEATSEYTLYNLAGGTKTFETDNKVSINYSVDRTYIENVPQNQPELAPSRADTLVDSYMRNVNLIPYGKYTFPDLQSKDLIKFFFTGPRDSKQVQEEAFIFLANVESLNDTFTPSIDPIHYLGRADPAFIYRSFFRTFDLSFKIVSFNKQQMRNNYRKLNYLASFTTPEYEACKMVTPFLRVTVGDYFNNCPVILTGFFINMTNETTWNTRSNEEEKQLPFVLDVSLNGYVITDKRPKRGGWFFGYEDWLDPYIEETCPSSERPYADIAQVQELAPISQGRFSAPVGGTTPGGQEIFNNLSAGVLQGNRGTL